MSEVAARVRPRIRSATFRVESLEGVARRLSFQQFGALSHQQSLSSIELLGNELIPAIASF